MSRSKLTKEEALIADTFHYGTCTKHVGKRGAIKRDIITYRRNGQTKTWKRNSSRFQVPVKHGLYDYGYVTDENADMWHTLDNCPAF